MASAGRPTKYNDDMLSKAQSYVQQCQKAKEMPFIEEIALSLDINEDTVVEWAKEYDEFSAAVKKLKLLQKLRLKQGALCKQLQPSTAIFLLKANHGLDEKNPDVQREEPKQHSVQFYHEEDILREINERLAESKAGRFEGSTGKLQYFTAGEAAQHPPVIIEKEPTSSGEEIARAERACERREAESSR